MALPGSNALQHSAAGSIEDGIHELSWPRSTARAVWDQRRQRRQCAV